ncbi:MAG: hypothetical protein WAT79_04410 [Saprospiraceae bacterium]
MSKYYSSPLLDSVKKVELRRRITFAIKSGNEDLVINSMRKEIAMSIDLINRSVRSNLSKIAELSVKTPVRVFLDSSVPQFPYYYDDVSEIFSRLNYLDELRIIIKLDNYDDKLIIDGISKNNISHLVEISIVDESKQDGKELSYFKKIKTNEIHKILNIIRDVIVDISMFHTYISPSWDISQKGFKSNFSTLKTQFVKGQNLTNDVWQEKDYISLAGYFNSDNGFDAFNYVQAWQSIESYITKTPTKSKRSGRTILDQLKRHNEFGQLSITQIQKLCSPLSEGEYILIRINRSPEKKKKKRSILTYFIGEKWRKGKINILPISYYNDVVRYSEWISIFKISI